MLWRLIFLGIAAYIIYRLIWGKKKGKPPVGAGPSGRGVGEEVLVQDPWCKTYLPKSQAIPMKGESGVVYFCSEECKERFLTAGDETNGEKRR